MHVNRGIRTTRSVGTRMMATGRLVLRGIGLGVRAAPREATAMVMFALVVGLAPTIIAVLQKGLVNHFARVIQHQAGAWTPFVVVAMVAIFLLSMASDASESANVFVMTSLRDKVEGVAKERLFHRLAHEPSLEPFERAEWLNAVSLAYQAIPRYQAISDRFASLLRGLFFVVPALIVCVGIAWWIPVLLILTVLPAGVAQFRIESRVWDAESTLAENRRRQTLVEETLTRPAYAKDIRLFTLGEMLVGRWRTHFLENLNTLNTIRLHGLRVTLLWSLLGAIGVGVPVVYIVNGVAGGAISIGDLVLFLGVSSLVRLGIQNLIWASSEIAGMTLAMDHYERFLAVEPGRGDVGDARDDLPPLRRSLSLANVSFRYPGSAELAIRDVSLTIDAGATVAIVGENGAGKSTIAKLLGRLYEPSEGSIFWDGADIGAIAMETYRARIGFMTQDIAEFPFTLRENLTFARLGNPPSDDELTVVLAATGLDSLVVRGELGLDTPLTKELNGGTQLSGGQWQRLALARVMLRAPDADLLMLDEPTAAFDPAAEHQLIGRLLEVSRDRTSIIITHRLALCTEVDRVIVMHEGRVIEDGTHRDLLAAEGHYASMFRAQARRYQVGASVGVESHVPDAE